MINIRRETTKDSKKPYVRDLKEGDVALIRYDGTIHLVYTYRSTHYDTVLQMVSLSSKLEYWDDISNNNFPVIRVFKPGDVLEVCE